MVGPPPLARGTRALCPRGTVRGRTTPARAGNTVVRVSMRMDQPDHPRSRGEHFRTAPQAETRAGPPPLARGTPPIALYTFPPHRTTPARAGNTVVSRCSSARTTDHPRSRGEHAVAVLFRPGDGGPPPLARGTHVGEHQRPLDLRTTPARAGNTPRLHSDDVLLADHPRSRGEHIVCPRKSVMWAGPPPLARGTRLQRWPDAHPRRTTPARAGNTPSRPGALGGLCKSFAIGRSGHTGILPEALGSPRRFTPRAVRAVRRKRGLAC